MITPTLASAITSDVPSPPRPPDRLLFIDNIRWVMIVLVLSMHAADTYSPFGNWYYTEHPTIGLPSAVFFATYQSFLQAFFMGLLFFVAGYFTPRSYDRKGRWRFLRDRAIRLGAPTVLYMLAIGPLTEYYVSHSWHTDASFRDAWWDYLRTGAVWSGTGPMWFCAALLIFCLVYAAVRSIPARDRAHAAPPPVRPAGDGVAAAVVAVLSLCTFGVRVVRPAGTSVYNMQLADFPQYIIFFALGVLAYRSNALTGSRLDHGFGMRWCRLALVGGSALWIALLVFGGALEGRTSAYGGGWHWQNAGMCVWAALIGVGMTLGLIVAFRDRYHAQGRLSRFMSANAFAVYVFHPPILIGVALALRPVAAPALVKFVLLTALSVVASFAVSDLIVRRVPLLRRIV